jgi:hypothetical protein
MRVTTAFIKDDASCADRALSEPLTRTKNGRDCRALRVGELTEEEVAVIVAAEVPAEHAHLDDELTARTP